MPCNNNNIIVTIRHVLQVRNSSHNWSFKEVNGPSRNEKCVKTWKLQNPWLTDLLVLRFLMTNHIYIFFKYFSLRWTRSILYNLLIWRKINKQTIPPKFKQIDFFTLAFSCPTPLLSVISVVNSGQLQYYISLLDLFFQASCIDC